jgi:SAM-dependent methyltransferase
MEAEDPMRVFDRRLVRARRQRWAASFAAHDFLVREAALGLAGRLDDIARGFPLALDLGCHDGVLARALGARGGIERLVQCDLSERMAGSARDGGALTLVADEETLPFAPRSFDLVLSGLNLHWVNDLPGALLQIRQALKPDGLFLAAMLGGRTLVELREAWLEAELATTGGVSPRVSPFADLADLGGLLQRAGFALPVVDSDTLTVTYPDPLALMRDLRGMGEANAAASRRRGFTRRATLAAVDEAYRRLAARREGPFPATFQIIYLTAWAPHPSQQAPLRPGSARSRLADALGAVERPAGEKTPPR